MRSNRPLSLDDVIDMKSVGGNFHLAPDGFEETVLMSPDGRQVFYSVSVADWDTNRRASTFYTVDSNGGEATEVTAVEGGSAFRYSPRGSYLSFTKPVSGPEQLFAMDRASGQVKQLSDRATDVFIYVWTEDESRIFFLAEDARSPEEQRRYELGDNWFAVDEAPNGRIAAQWRNLWRLDLKDGNEGQVTSQKLILDELDVSPDGKRVAFVARPDNRRNYPHTAELYVVDATGENLTRLTNNLAPESLPLWSPDGKRIAYYAPDDKTYELTKGYLWVMDPDTRKYKKLRSQNMGDIFTLSWSPDSKSLVFSEQQRMNTNIFRLDVDTDTLTPITDTEGSTKALAFSADLSRMAYSYTDFDTPLDIYTSKVDESSPIRLTNVNPWLESDIALGASRVIRWKSSDGLEIEGILTVPPGYDGSARVPLLVLIHGGPPNQWGNEFYYESHLYAGLGYAILAPNVRGSSGYGDRFRQSSDRRYRRRRVRRHYDRRGLRHRCGHRGPGSPGHPWLELGRCLVELGDHANQSLQGCLRRRRRDELALRNGPGIQLGSHGVVHGPVTLGGSRGVEKNLLADLRPERDHANIDYSWRRRLVQ